VALIIRIPILAMPIGMHFDSKDSFTCSTNIKKNKEQGWLTDSITIHNFKNEGFKTTLKEKEPQVLQG